MMAENYSCGVLRIVIAQLCQAVGFDSIQSSALDILTNIIEHFLQMVGKTVHDYGVQCGQTFPKLSDVMCAFQLLNISLADIMDYMKQMEPIKFSQCMANFPAPKKSNLNFPSGHASKDFSRDEYIYLHMPTMVLNSLKPEGHVMAEKNAKVVETATEATFVIAGKHQLEFSSDEDIYSVGENLSDEHTSDDPATYNLAKSRRLTKPEDIPMVDGIAPSSFISMSTSELDWMHGCNFPYRSEINSSDGVTEESCGNDESNFLMRGCSVLLGNAPQPFSPKPNLREHSSDEFDKNFKKVDYRSVEPSWLAETKNSNDVYDLNWLKNDTSPVQLNKPPTPDLPKSSRSAEKKPWSSKDEQISDSIPTKSALKKQRSSFSRLKSSLSSSNSFEKHSVKQMTDRKSPHKELTTLPSVKKSALGDAPIKAKIEAADRLLQSVPVPSYIPSILMTHDKKNFTGSLKSQCQSDVYIPEEKIPSPTQENLFANSGNSSTIIYEKQNRSNFASSKSMYDAIDAVISRATEESKKRDKEAEEKELMRFSHLVNSSSSDSESDVSTKAEQMLQLQERGLQGAHLPTPSSTIYVDSPIMTSDSDEYARITPKKMVTTSTNNLKSKMNKKNSHKVIDPCLDSTIKTHSKSKNNSSKPASFVTTETITSQPVKMKVKLKHLHHEPKLFDVDKDQDRVKIITHSLKHSKEEKLKSKESKLHMIKDHKLSSRKDKQGDCISKDHSIGKIILKKSKSGDTKVVKPKVKDHARSPSPVCNPSHLPLPKLSAAIPVRYVTVTASKEKEKKKTKKEKKKRKDREKDKNSERDWNQDKDKLSDKQKKEGTYLKEMPRKADWDPRQLSCRELHNCDLPSPIVPKLTLKMGTNEKKFVIKPSMTTSKSANKKRSHSLASENPSPAKERKVSVECVKTVSEGFAAAVERKVITQTISAGPVGVYEDADGNKVWICPGCNKPDDGSPMIGCDTCDDWYHWPCVGIATEPPENQDWYCPRCIKRQQDLAKGKTSIKRRKKK